MQKPLVVEAQKLTWFQKMPNLYLLVARSQVERVESSNLLRRHRRVGLLVSCFNQLSEIADLKCTLLSFGENMAQGNALFPISADEREQVMLLKERGDTAVPAFTYTGYQILDSY